VGPWLKLEPADDAVLISADHFRLRHRHADPVAGCDAVVHDLRRSGAAGRHGQHQRRPKGARAIFGAIIAAGIISILIAPVVSRLVRFFPPVSTGKIILASPDAAWPLAT